MEFHLNEDQQMLRDMVRQFEERVSRNVDTAGELALCPSWERGRPALAVDTRARCPRSRIRQRYQRFARKD